MNEIDQAEARAVDDSLIFIRDFINGETVLNVTFRGKRPVGASLSCPQDQRLLSCVSALGGRDILARLLRRKKQIRSFKWSGPVQQ
jgi:hypothetical protein